MKQVFLFVGDNSYLLEGEVRRWKEEFEKKHGQENLIVLEGAAATCAEILDSVATMPFIAERRLVIVRGIPKLQKEQIDILFKVLHPAIVLVIVEAKPDRRLATTKEWLNRCEVRDFLELPEKQLLQWMNEFAVQCGSSLAPEASRALLKMLGHDQYFLASEIKKLACFCSTRQITTEDVNALTAPSTQNIDWHFMDLIIDGSQPEVLRHVAGLLDRGESPHAIWNMLLWIVTSLCQVWMFANEGITNPLQISKESDVKFLTAKNLLRKVKKLSPQRMQILVSALAESDVHLKSGVYKSSGDAEQEMIAVLEYCLHQVLAT